MSCLIVLKDAFSIVDPAVFVAHLFSGRGGDGLLGVLGLIGLNVEWLLALLFTL